MTWRNTTRCYTPLLVPSPAKPTLQRAAPPPRRTRSARRIGQHKRTPHLHAPTPNLDHMLSATTLIGNEELALTQILVGAKGVMILYYNAERRVWRAMDPGNFGALGVVDFRACRLDGASLVDFFGAAFGRGHGDLHTDVGRGREAGGGEEGDGGGAGFSASAERYAVHGIWPALGAPGLGAGVRRWG